MRKLVRYNPFNDPKATAPIRLLVPNDDVSMPGAAGRIKQMVVPLSGEYPMLQDADAYNRALQQAIAELVAPQ
jgi:hypothetical protein